MNLAKHCELCDHQKVNLKDGTTCGLTNLKPDFKTTCADIKLREKFESKLKLVNITFEKYKRKKSLVMGYFVIFQVLGISVIYFGYYLGKYILEVGYISTIPIIFFVVGFILLGIGFGALNGQRNDMNLASKDKNELDSLLEKYRITYKIYIRFGKTYHGIQDVDVDLTTKGIPN